MRQTLFYLPVEILGVPLFGRGVLFWAILLAGVIAIVRALLQKKKIEDSIFYACIAALGLFVVNTIGPRIAEPQGFPIRGYGVFLTLAIVVSSAITARRGKNGITRWTLFCRSSLWGRFAALLERGFSMSSNTGAIFRQVPLWKRLST